MPPRRCNFDQDTCYWNNSQRFLADWAHMSSLASGFQGRGSQGKFMALEGKGHQMVKAILISPTFQVSSDAGIHFFFAVIVGVICFIVRGPGLDERNRTFSAWRYEDTMASQRLMWEERNIPIPAAVISGFRNYKIEIWGEVSTPDSVVAIDDVTVRATPLKLVSPEPSTAVTSTPRRKDTTTTTGTTARKTSGRAATIAATATPVATMVRQLTTRPLPSSSQANDTSTRSPPVSDSTLRRSEIILLMWTSVYLISIILAMIVCSCLLHEIDRRRTTLRHATGVTHET